MRHTPDRATSDAAWRNNPTSVAMSHRTGRKPHNVFGCPVLQVLKMDGAPRALRQENTGRIHAQTMATGARTHANSAYAGTLEQPAIASIREDDLLAVLCVQAVAARSRACRGSTQFPGDKP